MFLNKKTGVLQMVNKNLIKNIRDSFLKKLIDISKQKREKIKDPSILLLEYKKSTNEGLINLVNGNNLSDQFIAEIIVAIIEYIKIIKGEDFLIKNLLDLLDSELVLEKESYSLGDLIISVLENENLINKLLINYINDKQELSINELSIEKIIEPFVIFSILLVAHSKE
jgi:hypothetical protein